MKLVNRVGLYFIGLFIITIGINLSINLLLQLELIYQ